MEFLEPQLRASSARTVRATFELSFAEELAMEGNAAQTLTDRLVPLRQRRCPRLGDGGAEAQMSRPEVPRENGDAGIRATAKRKT